MNYNPTDVASNWDRTKQYITRKETEDKLFSNFMVEPKFFVIEKEIINLLQKTKTTKEYIKLPFEPLFICNTISFKDIEINGIFLRTIQKNEIQAIIRINKTRIIMVPLNDISKRIKPLKNQQYTKEGEIELIKLSEEIRLLIRNILLFIVNPEVEYIEHKPLEKQNTKRLSRGKVILYPTTEVRCTGKLKIYLDKIKAGGHLNYSHRFWVRGHWRTLRNEQRYKERAGKKLWIVPYIKGEGILIDKIIDVTK